MRGAEESVNPGQLINRTSRLMNRWLDERLRGLGLAAAQVPVLSVLRGGTARSQKELAERMQVEQPTMAQLLARMERDGLIRREPDPTDGRSSRVLLTEAAKAKLPAAKALLEEGSGQMLAGLTEREVATLGRLLERVLRNVQDAVGR